MTGNSTELLRKIEQLERSIGMLSQTSAGQTNELRQTTNLLRQSLAEKTSTLPTIANEVAHNHNQIGSLLERLDHMEHVVKRLLLLKERSQPDQLMALFDRVEALEQTIGRLAEADEVLPDIQQTLSTLLARADHLDASVGRLQTVNAENVHQTFVALFTRLEHLEGIAGQLALNLDHVVNALASFSKTAEQQISDIHSEYRRENDHEAKRVDYALGEIEGLAPLREEFHATRKTADYARAFDEAEPLVSVCVATYNRSDLLIERCLNSLVHQTYRNLEIIVVGDHCTDDTEERIRALGDPRITFHNLPSPSVYPAPGIDRWRVAGTTAFNVARAKARGVFIAHLDDDDSSDPSRIEILVREAQKHRADFVWHSHWREDQEGQWTVSQSRDFKLTQVNMGMCLYHRYFLRLDLDIHAYRMDEPGDWNFLRRLKHLRPNMRFVDMPLTRYFALPKRPPFEPRPDEAYLD